MRIDEVTGEFTKVRAIMYNHAGDKAVYHWKNMRQMTGSIYVGEAEPDGYGNDCFYVFVKWPEVDVALYLDKTNGWRTDDELLRWAERDGLSSEKMFIDKMKSRISEPSWIKLTELEMIKHVAPELEDAALEAREEVRKIREAKRAQREQEREEEDRKFVDGANAHAQGIVDNAAGLILNGGDLKNVDITFWEDRYTSKTYSLVNYMMGLYGINVPIRTKGWIKERLNSVRISESGVVVGCNWMRSGRGKVSESFWDYMDELVKTVRGDKQ